MWWFTFTRSKFLKGWFTPRSNVFGRIFIIFLLEQRIVNWTIIQSWRKESLLCWMLLWINLRFLKYLRRSPQSDSCNKILNLGISLTNLRSQTEFRYRDWVFYGTFPRYFERGGYSPSARWKKRERRGQAFKDNRSFYIIGIHYTTPFSITEESVRGTPLTETILWCFFFLLLFFLAHLLSILEIQTETTMNHVLIDSTRDPLLLPFRLHRRWKRKGRVASGIAKPLPYREETKDGRSFRSILLLIVHYFG